MTPGKTRATVDIAINGKVDRFQQDEVTNATLQALRVTADDVDELRSEILGRLDRLSKTLTAIASTVGAGVLVAAIVAALRLS